MRKVKKKFSVQKNASLPPASSRAGEMRRHMMKHIFDKAELKHLTMKNRLVRSATWEGIANGDGSLPGEVYEIYRELASGGVGAVITGFTDVSSRDFYILLTF